MREFHRGWDSTCKVEHFAEKEADYSNLYEYEREIDVWLKSEEEKWEIYQYYYRFFLWNYMEWRIWWIGILERYLYMYK